MGKAENKFLGKEKITKLLLKFSILCVLSLLISALYNIVDQIFIGRDTETSAQTTTITSSCLVQI